MSTTLDLILFGATGFTGKLCIKHLIDNYCNDKHSFKFGLAARNIDKLKCVLSGFTDLDEKEKDTCFELIKCDSDNEEEINSMISKTRVIITTVGPYCVYGEKLISLCCKNGVDYIDLCGETHWVKNMINKYQNDAIDSKARIVNIAGMVASISDCAVSEAVHKLKDDEKCMDENYRIKSMVEAPLNATTSESGGSSASILNIFKQNGFNNYYDANFAYSLCPEDNSYKNMQQGMKSIFPRWNEEIKRYEMRLVLGGQTERMVFCRTNHLLGYYYGKEPMIDEEMVVLPSKYYILALLLGILYFVLPFLLIKMSFLKPLSIKIMQYIFPKPGDGPTMEKMLSVKWKQYIFVESVKDKNKKMRVNVDINGDYMYYNTAKILVEQGIIFAMERKENTLKDDTKYGFLTPAVAFGERLIQRLNHLKEFDIKFQS